MLSLNSWTKGIKGRLFVAALMPFVAFGAIFAFTYSGLNTLSGLLGSAHQEIIPNISALDDIRIAQNHFGYRMWEGLVNPEDRKETNEECKNSIEMFKSAYKRYASNPFSPDEKVLFDEVKDTFAAYMTVVDSIYKDAETNTPESIKQAQANLDEKLHPLAMKLEDFNEKATALYEKRAVKESAESHDARERIIMMSTLVTLLAGLGIMGFLMWIGSRVSSSVGEIAERLSDASDQVAGAVSQLSLAGNSLSDSSTESAASLEETAASLEEMSSMVKMSADNANQAAQLAQTSRESAQQGETEIRSLIQAMSDISDSSKKIEEIISVIDDIAFQTNLLALNAAVEAARAGEQGKGFAVVAEAVRALAQRSASSAKDISSLIQNSAEKVALGGKIADSSGAVLNRIVESISQVSELNSKIATASAEQTTGIQQINKAMNSLDQTAQSNAASAEEIAATTSEINHLAQTSAGLSRELTKVVLGTNAEGSHSEYVEVPVASKTKPGGSKKAA